MLVVDKLLMNGIGFVLRRVAEAVDAERLDDAVLREELLEAQLKLEQREIDDEEYAAIESDVFARMRELRERARGGEEERGPLEASRLEIEAIEADAGDDRLVPAAPPARKQAPKTRKRARRR